MNSISTQTGFQDKPEWHSSFHVINEVTGATNGADLIFEFPSDVLISNITIQMVTASASSWNYNGYGTGAELDVPICIAYTTALESLEVGPGNSEVHFKFSSFSDLSNWGKLYVHENPPGDPGRVCTVTHTLPHFIQKSTENNEPHIIFTIPSEIIPGATGPTIADGDIFKLIVAVTYFSDVDATQTVIAHPPI